MTIVGIEKLSDGTKNLIVFDPMYHDPPAVMKHAGSGQKFVHRNPEDALKLYRRGKKYLGKYNEYEILTYVSSLFSIHDLSCVLGEKNMRWVDSVKLMRTSLCPPVGQKGDVENGILNGLRVGE